MILQNKYSRNIYRNHSRQGQVRQKSQSLSPSSGHSPMSSSLSSFIINDPTSASSTTTLRTPTQPEAPMVLAYNKVRLMGGENISLILKIFDNYS